MEADDRILQSEVELTDRSDANFVAAGIWAAAFVAAGWFLAEWLGPSNVGWALGAIGLIVIGSLVVRARAASRRRSAAATISG